MDIEEKQRLNQEQLALFRAEIKETCVVCEAKSFGIARTQTLCRKHYKRVVVNNKFRHENGLDITTNIPKDL